MSDNGLTGIKKQWVGGDEVIITRAQYYALMAAVKAVKDAMFALDGIIDGDFEPNGLTVTETFKSCRECVAALRAAGIQTEEP